jgi:hypothetical protein
MPVTWVEVETALEARDPRSLRFGFDEAIDRVERLGDLLENGAAQCRLP